jgi:hypothetical protein
MNYRLVKTTHKQSIQEWKLWINTAHSISSVPDPRDSTLEFTEAEKQVIIDYINNVNKIQPGYQGWDRVYPDDDTLVVTYYFDTEQNARNYRVATRDPNNPYYIAFMNVMSAKDIPDYQVTWELFSPDDQPLTYVGN